MTPRPQMDLPEAASRPISPGVHALGLCIVYLAATGVAALLGVDLVWGAAFAGMLGALALLNHIVLRLRRRAARRRDDRANLAGS